VLPPPHAASNNNAKAAAIEWLRVRAVTNPDAVLFIANSLDCQNPLTQIT
jgi:hypothetical protein